MSANVSQNWLGQETCHIKAIIHEGSMIHNQMHPSNQRITRCIHPVLTYILAILYTNTIEFPLAPLVLEGFRRSYIYALPYKELFQGWEDNPI